MKQETLYELTVWTEGFALTEDGKWLNDFDWKAIPVDWSDKCNANNGIMGMYSFGKIYLMNLENIPEYIWPTYIHELYHRWQWTTNPVKYIIGKLIRPIIENPADEMTIKAEHYIDNLIKEE